MTTQRAPGRARESSVSYKVPQNGISEQELHTITRRIVRAVHPYMIVLFGSRVYGKPRSDSDLDVLVIVETKGTPWQRSQRLVKLFRTFPLKLDVHARTPSELIHRLEIGDDFIQEIVRRGKLLYPKPKGNGFLKLVDQALRRGQEHPADNFEIVQEWVQKGEGEYQIVKFWARQRQPESHDYVCYYSNQCVQNYLKAFLVRERVKFGPHYGLVRLWRCALHRDPDFRSFSDGMKSMDPCTLKVLFPGASASDLQARAAYQAAQNIRQFVRAKLGLK